MVQCMETIEEGTDSTAALPSQGKEEKAYCEFRKKKKKRLLMLSVTSAGS